eukprot:1194300-Prorocentrum_minimum.AAC.1
MGIIRAKVGRAVGESGELDDKAVRKGEGSLLSGVLSAPLPFLVGTGGPHVVLGVDGLPGQYARVGAGGGAPRLVRFLPEEQKVKPRREPLLARLLHLPRGDVVAALHLLPEAEHGEGTLRKVLVGGVLVLGLLLWLKAPLEDGVLQQPGPHRRQRVAGEVPKTPNRTNGGAFS